MKYVKLFEEFTQNLKEEFENEALKKGDKFVIGDGVSFGGELKSGENATVVEILPDETMWVRFEKPLKDKKQGRNHGTEGKISLHSVRSLTEAKIVLDTVLGEDPGWDEDFFEYLRSKGITYKQIGKVNGWPEVEYVGSKEALADMAKSHFELADDEIEELMIEGRLLDIFEREERKNKNSFIGISENDEEYVIGSIVKILPSVLKDDPYMNKKLLSLDYEIVGKNKDGTFKLETLPDLSGALRGAMIPGVNTVHLKLLNRDDKTL